MDIRRIVQYTFRGVLLLIAWAALFVVFVHILVLGLAGAGIIPGPQPRSTPH